MRFALLLGTAIGVNAVAQDGSPPDADRSSDPAALTAALQRAADDRSLPFHLLVHCLDEQGIRSLEVFRSGVAIWNARKQVEVAESTRSKLLQTLLDGDFPGFEPRYGGRPEPEKADAALRISCRIKLEIDNLEKTSVQLADGEQSRSFAALATSLLDLGAASAASGVAPRSLEDGLEKLARGTLAAETFELRYVKLPATRNGSPGTILRVQAGRISRQAYAPGRRLDKPDWKALPGCATHELVTALQTAGIWTLPVNIDATGHIELEARVLRHRKTVIARPFGRPAQDEPDPARRRFASLARFLDRWSPATAECPPKGNAR